MFILQGAARALLPSNAAVFPSPQAEPSERGLAVAGVRLVPHQNAMEIGDGEYHLEAVACPLATAVIQGGEKPF